MESCMAVDSQQPLHAISDFVTISKGANLHVRGDTHR